MIFGALVWLKSRLLACFVGWAKTLDASDLEFASYSAPDVIGVGLNVVDGDHYVFALLAYREDEGGGTANEEAFLKLVDDDTNESTSGDQRACLPILDDNDMALLVFPNGVFTTVGIVLGSHTSATGTSNSVSGDAPSGFIIYGTSRQ